MKRALIALFHTVLIILFMALVGASVVGIAIAIRAFPAYTFAAFCFLCLCGLYVSVYAGLGQQPPTEDEGHRG